MKRLHNMGEASGVVQGSAVLLDAVRLLATSPLRYDLRTKPQEAIVRAIQQAKLNYVKAAEHVLEGFEDNFALQEELLRRAYKSIAEEED